MDCQTKASAFFSNLEISVYSLSFWRRTAWTIFSKPTSLKTKHYWFSEHIWKTLLTVFKKQYPEMMSCFSSTHLYNVNKSLCLHSSVHSNTLICFLKNIFKAFWNTFNDLYFSKCSTLLLPCNYEAETVANLKHSVQMQSGCLMREKRQKYWCAPFFGPVLWILLTVYIIVKKIHFVAESATLPQWLATLTK